MRDWSCPHQAIRSDSGVVAVSLWPGLTRLVREEVNSYKGEGPAMLFVVAHADVLTFHEAGVGIKEEARRDVGLRVGSRARAFDV